MNPKNKLLMEAKMGLYKKIIDYLVKREEPDDLMVYAAMLKEVDE